MQDNNTPIFRVSLANGASRDYTEQEYRDLHIADWLNENHSGKYNVFRLNDAAADSVTKDQQYVVSFTQDGQTKSKLYSGQDFMNLDMGNWLEQNHPGNYKIQSVRGYSDANLAADEDYWKKKADEQKAAIGQFEQDNHDFMFKHEMDKIVYDAGEGNIVDDNYMENDAKYRGLISQKQALQAEYSNNPYIKSIYKSEAEYADGKANEYDGILEEMRKKNPFLGESKQMQSGTQAENDEFKYFQQAKKLEKDVAKIFAIETIKAPGENGFADYMRNYAKAHGNTFSDVDFWSRGLTEISRNLNIRDIMKKLQAKGLDLNQLTEKDLDDNLTPGEKALLQGFARKAYAQAQRAEDMAPGYTAGRTAAESLGFMAEFLVTGAIGRGLGAAEEAGATGLKSWIARELRTGSANAIESSVKRGMINAFTKGGEKALTEGAKKAVRAASSVASGAYSAVARPLEQAVWHTALQPSTYRQISENLTQIQENGELIDAGNAIWGGVLDQLVENWSESMGGAVETVLGMPFKAAGWAGEKVLGKTTLGQWGKWLADSQAARVLYNAGFNGLIGEMGEEWLGNAARVGLGIMSKDEFKDFASWHEQLEMAASFAPMSLFGLGMSAYAASKQAKDYKQTAEAMRGVLNRAGMTEDEIADIMDTKHTKKEIADALTPVIQRIVHGRQDNSVAFDDYVTTLKFAQASAMNEVLATAQSIERGKERDAMRNQIGQELGATSAEDERGKFTHVINSERLDADGNPYELEAVTTVKDADGNEWFYMGNQGSQVVLKKMGEDGGKPMFLTQEQYAQRVESGEYTENTQLATQYLDQRIEQQRAEEERVRKNQEVQDNYSRIFAALQQNPEITVGTEDAPMTGTVVQVARDGVVVDFGKPVLLNGVTRPVHKLSLEQAGNALGIDAAMRSDEQMDRDSADQDDLNRKRISAYNNTFKDKDFTLNGDPYTFVRMFEAPYLDEDGTELVRVTATDAMGNDVELVLPLKDLEEQALTSEEQAQSDADQEDVNLSVTDQTTGSLKDFRGNDIPMRQNEKTGEEEVDKREFKRRDPEAYYRWNDSRRGGNTSDSMEAIQADIAVKSSEKDKLAAQKQSETDPDMRDELEAQITNLDNEINLLSGIYHKYDAASNFQQRQTEYAQRFADIKQRMLKAKTQEQYDELVEMQRQLSMDYFTEMRDAAQTLSLNQHAVELQQALNEMADLPVQVTTYARIEEDMINDQASRASIDKVLDKIASVQRENMATGSNLAIDGFHHNGKVYIFAEGNRTVADATVTYYHERQHDINKTNPKAVDDVLALANNDEQALYDTLTHIIGNAKSYEGASARVLADEIVAFTMEKAWTNPNYVDELKALGLSNELINIISTEYGRQQGTSEDLNQRSGDRTSYDGTGGQPNYRIDEQAQEGESGDEQLGSSQPGNEAEEVGLTEKTQKELAEKGLVMDGGVVMASALSDLKQATGYLTPNEISPEADAVAFSIRTKNAWAANYRKYPGSEERVIRALENLAERMAADELVSGVISQGDYKYGQKANGSFAGPLRTNIEYVVTFDMDTTCPRTFQYLNYVKQIEKRIGRPLTQTECIQLTEMMRMYGQQIPCVYCYSENKRQAMKQYYTDFMTARQAVLNAATDEEALEHMYGHGTSKAAKESKDPAVALNEAAYKVFLEWRANRKSAYNPSLKMLWYQYSNDRNTVLSVLDQLYADGRIMTDLNDDIIAAVVDTELRINDKQAVKVVEDIVSEWKWDAIEGRQHSDYTPVDEDEWVVDPRTLSLWREMTAYAKSASQAKSVLRYVPYTDELKKLSQEQKDYINGMGGVRMHSSNDFRIDYVFDYFQFMADMAANKMFGHTYTKSPEFVRIFGNSGYKINMSIAAYEDEKGNIRMNEDEGFNWDEAKRLREAFPNAGVMLMATSDNQIQMALDSDWIDMFIPFHASSLPKAVWYNMRMWQDYSTVQNEAFLNGDEMKAALIADGVELPKKIKATEVEQMYLDHFKIKTIIGTTGKKKGKRLRPHFLPGPTVVDGQYVPGHNNDPELYKQLCIEYGVHPRFYGVKVKDAQGNTIDITEHPNYIKCIKETSRTDSPQTPIQFNFDQPSEALGGKSPIEYAFDELQVRAAAEMEAAGAPVRDIYKSLEKDTFGIVPQFIDTIIKHKETTGKDYPLDYLTPDSRKWFLTERKALEEAYKDVETIPYHRNEYDVNGEPMMRVADNAEDQAEIQKALDLVNGEGTFAEEGGDIRYSIRTKPAPKSTGIGYKVFYLKDGKLYPPMVANPDGAETPVGVWLDADAAPQAATSKTGRKKVKAGGKGTQGGSGTLAYRPGWHLGEIPYALQFNRGPKVDNPLGITGKNGKVIKVGKYFPANFVWAEVEYAKDVDYQDEAMSYGYNKAGNFQHSLAGLPKVPEDGSYTYRTNANPATDPWIITGAMKVNRILTDSEVDELVSKAGREPQAREDNPKAFEERMAVVNRDQKRADGQYADAAELDDIMFRLSNNNRATISKWLDKWAEARVAEVSKKYGANTPRESFEEAAAKQKEDILNYLDKLNDSTMQLAWARWFCTGAVQMGAEDMPKVRQAVKIAKIHKVDPLQYDSPMSIINQWPESVKDDPINPDEVPTLHKVKELPDGIVIYDVDESEESRKNMREIINTHFGKDCSPWCLLQGDGNGKLTKYSADYWYKTYTAYTKQVAFKNGKLVAFSANSNEERLWWDRQDSSHHGIPVIGKIKGDKLGRSATMEYSPEDGSLISVTNIVKGNKKDGKYMEWFSLDNETPRVEETFDHGYLVGRRVINYENGQIRKDENYENGSLSGRAVTYFQDGQIETDANYVRGRLEGPFTSYHENGQVYYTGTYERGDKVGRWQTFYKDGQMSADEVYAKSWKPLESVTYYPDGSKKSESHSVSRPYGFGTVSEQEWDEQGRLVRSVRMMESSASHGYYDGDLHEITEYEYNELGITMKKVEAYREQRGMTLYSAIYFDDVLQKQTFVDKGAYNYNDVIYDEWYTADGKLATVTVQKLEKYNGDTVVDQLEYKYDEDGNVSVKHLMMPRGLGLVKDEDLLVSETRDLLPGETIPRVDKLYQDYQAKQLNPEEEQEKPAPTKKTGKSIKDTVEETLAAANLYMDEDMGGDISIGGTVNGQEYSFMVFDDYTYEDFLENGYTEDELGRATPEQEEAYAKVQDEINYYQTHGYWRDEVDEPMFRATQIAGNPSLIAVHNLTENDLLNAFDLGGFPMPSIAITKADIGHTDFGDISLVFDKETINPKNRKNKVYSGDAWTPTFPTINYKLNEDKASDIATRARKVGDLPLFNPSHFNSVNYEGGIEDFGARSLIEEFKNDYNAKQFYLAEQGNPVREFEMHEVEKYTEENVRRIKELLDKIGLENLKGADRNLTPEILQVVKGFLNGYSNTDDALLKQIARNYVIRAIDYATNGNKTAEIDYDATYRKIDERIDQSAFEKWLEDLFSGIVEKRGIRNEVDMFTPIGNRRAWEKLYDEVTLDNVVKAMSKKPARGGSGFFGGNIFGASFKTYNSIADIREDAARRMAVVDSEELQKQKDDILNRLSNVKVTEKELGVGEMFDLTTNIKDAVAESHTAEGIHRYLKDYYPDITMEAAQEIADIVKDIQSISTKYFEAKPYRAVGFDEVKLAVVPEGTSQAIVDGLQERGVPVRTYEKDNQQERMDIISNATEEMGLRFRTVEITPETRGEMEQIEAIARVNGTYLKAPNGADTKLNPEQWSMVRTKAFKNWFGDWENDPANASKIVDENGEPIVVYRGQNWDKKDGKMTSGLFVSLDEDFAEGYGDVKPLFVRSVNPFNGEKDAESLRQFVEENFDELQAEYEEFYDEGEGYEDVDSLMDALNENWWIAYEYSDILRNEIIRRGYDSIFIREDADNIWLTSPDQIKSATNNNGSFDPNDPDIRYRVVPGGESMAERAYRESGAFSFTGSERINSIDDVAFIFRELENYATENSFIVLVKDGMPTILHTGIGDMTSTFIDTAAAIAGYNDFAPDTVYLVHNHPSGNLVASAADINELAKLKDIFSGVPVSGIILDTVSGNYGYFDEGINIEKAMPEEGDEFPVKVLSFDKVVFDKEFKSQLNERKIAGPYDVAAFLSAHRLGKGKKLGVLLLNNAQYIVANYVTNDNSLTTRNADRIARQVANVAVHSNANRAIMFGNFNFDDKSLRSFSRSFKKASGETMSLLDVVQMNPDGGYVSVNNDTLHGRNDGTMFRVTPAQDQEYRQAYENNDTAKAEQMVKDAFNAAYPNNKLGARSFYKGKNGEWENQIAGYFTDDFEFANHYGSGDVKECFLVMENPYEYDFKESGSDGDFEGLDGEIRETRGVMQDADAEAREKGLKPYDGYILRNVGEGYGPGSYVVDDYIVKDPKQVKSAEPFTFDDNGELIPLSRRFNPESDDIRFRISARSSEGENLSEGQQAYFANSKAVDEKGNLLTLYHGTPRAGFNEFRSGFFTTSKKDADSYGGNDREGKLYNPNERASSEKVIAGDFRLGYMTFDSEEDRADFLAKHPLAEDAMTLSQLNEAIDNANYDGDAELEKELESKRDAYKKIEKDYRDYEFGHLVTTTWNDLLANPSAYTENDFRRAFLAYDSNAVFDGIDDMDHEDRIDAYIDALNYAVEESAAEGGDALSIEFYSRVPRNGEGTRAKDMRHRTYKVYINVENPFEMDAKGRHSEFESGDVYESIKNAMADPQYDGVIVRNWRVGRYQELGDVVVPKDKNQIKLTTNINPTESDDIRFRISGENATFAEEDANELANDIANEVYRQISSQENSGNLATEVDSESDGEVLFRFIGELGADRLDKTDGGRRILNLIEAKKYYTPESAENIKRSYGWELDKDAKGNPVWKYEENDFGINDLDIKDGAKLSDVIDDEGLFAAYPELKNYTLAIEDLKDASGYFNETNKKIALKKGVEKEDDRLTLIHEIQHFIQRKEGWVRGTNDKSPLILDTVKDIFPYIRKDLNMFLKSAAKRIFNKSYKKESISNFRFFKDKWGFSPIEYLFYLKKTNYLAYEAYLRKAGEVEARNAEKRADMTALERRRSLASETEDRPRSRQWRKTPYEDVMFSIRQKDAVNKAMSGLQNFNDDEINDMLMDTFEAVTPEIRAKIVDNAPETGYDFGKATVRTFADLAEREDKLTAEEWNAIATLRDNMKDALGIDVLSLNDTLWSMYQTSTFGEIDILSAARRAIVADKLGHSPADEAKRQQAEDELRFSIREGMESTSAAEMYNRATNYWMNRLKESYVDMNESVNDLVAAIEKATGIDAEAFEDVRLALNQQSSKGLAAMTKYTADYLEPLWSAIHDVMEATGMSYDDVVRYVMLKHAVERNDVFARRDAKAFYQAEFDNVVNPLRKDRKQLERDRKKALAAGDLMTANDCDNKIQAIDLQIAAEQKKLDRHNKMVDNGTAAKYHEYRENDYGGLTSMYSEYPGLQPREYYKTDEEYNQAARKVRKPLYQTVGEMEVSALGEVDAMEQRTSGDEFDKLWEKINAATKATLESQYKSNVISKAQYDAVRDQFQYYVPLRGFKDTTAEDIWTYFNASHSGSFSPALLGARGRKSEAENPFNWIGTMASSAIAQNLKNESKMALYYFIANRPNQDLVSVKDVWYQFDAQATADYQAANPGSKKRIFTAVYPPFNESLDTDAAKQAYDLWEESMEQQAQNGLAYRGTNKLDIKDDVAFIDAKEAPQHIIRMKLRGKDVSLIINGNPRAAQAINGLLNIETEGGYQKIFGPILRWMSAVNTSYNPEFWISNMQRDLLFATMGMDIKGDGASNLFKNLVNPKKIMKMMRAYEDGTLGNSEVENYYREFAESGAITGFTVVSGNETWEKEIADFLDPSVLTKIKDSKFMKFWQDLGEAVEQMARFSAYMTARKSGKDIIESTNAAKEITVNFNRKGSGRHISVDELKTLTTKSGRHLNDAEKAAVFVMSLVPAYGRRMIMFFNAATQGLNAMYKLWKKNPKRFAGWMTGYFAVGVMQAVLHALLDDDDDYMDMPEYTKRNNLLLGYDGIYLKWAMPQEARMFYAFGDMAVNHIMGRTPNKILAGEMLSAMADVMPLSATDGVTGLLPSAAQPFIELYTNKDFTGARIYNDMRFLSEDERSRTPNHPNALPNTGKIFVNVSKVLNEISGGNDWDAGFINIHPESIQHVVEGAGGGLLTTLNKVYETVGGAIDKAAGVPITGEELSVRRFPFLNRLLQVNDERSRNSHVGELFYYYKAEAEHTKSKISKFRKNGDSDAMSDLMDSKEYEIYMIYKSYEKLMRSFDDQIKIEEDKDEKKALMREQDQYRKDMIREISELE